MDKPFMYSIKSMLISINLWSPAIATKLNLIYFKQIEEHQTNLGICQIFNFSSEKCLDRPNDNACQNQTTQTNHFQASARSAKRARAKRRLFAAAAPFPHRTEKPTMTMMTNHDEDDEALEGSSQDWSAAPQGVAYDKRWT